MENYTTTVFFNVQQDFFKHMQDMINSISGPTGVFAGDQLFTFHRNLSFLSDPDFMSAFQANAETQVEQAIIWRTAVLAWAARHAMHLEGDFVECACYKGTSAKIICDMIDFKSLDRKYYLYDLFDHDPDMPHHAMSEHSKELYAQTKEKFEEYPNVIVTQGKVPDVLHEVAPTGKIALMHIDLNNADAEVGALDVLFDQMVPGALLVLDDYGWLYYKEQKIAEDKWFAERGYFVLELPTGQGLVIKR